MQGDSPSLRGGARACSVRNLCLALVTAASVTLLVWMYKETSYVQKYTELAAATWPSGRPPPESTRPINVVINMPAENRTVVAQQQQQQQQQQQKWDYNWDRKAWKDSAEAQGVPIRTLVLVRHGKYDLNTGHLTDKGRRQANLTGQRLRTLNMAYDRIIHSTMDRARETAQLVHGSLPELPMSEDSLITEGGPVPPDPTVGYWGLPDRSYFVDGPRMEAGFREHFYRADKTQSRESIDILVGHGNIFRYFILRALQFPANGWMRLFLPHASISLVHINPDGTVTMTKIGDSGHLPPDLVTI